MVADDEPSEVLELVAVVEDPKLKPGAATGGLATDDSFIDTLDGKYLLLLSRHAAPSNV